MSSMDVPAGQLAGKVGIVTGAAQGIGEGIAELFAREGATLVLADLNAERGREVAQRLKSNGSFGEILFRRCDVAHAAQVHGLVDTAVRELGRLDIVINNAGYAVYKGVEETSEEEWNAVIGVCFSSLFYATKYAAPYLRKTHGAIVNIASIRALATTSDIFAYSAAKAGVIGLTRAAALDLAPDVRVNCILPGAVDTPLHRENVAAIGPLEEGMRKVREGIPMKRHGTPTDIAKAALFLCTEASSWATGAPFIIDGGTSSLIAG
ncbi:MAG TPA: glucose 1-dehydrogenase [Chloroflexota bacterium]|nr:glucose 1-dehydrogenase [Chloroflexota bacterium]